MTILYYRSGKKHGEEVTLHDHSTSPVLPEDLKKKKAPLYTEDEKDFIYKCGAVWRTRNPLTVVVKEKICPSILFGKYYSKLKEKLDNGLVSVKIESELNMNDLDNFIEFN